MIWVIVVVGVLLGLLACGAASLRVLPEYERGIVFFVGGQLVLIGVLTALHIAGSKTRALSIALVVSSLLVVWLGVELSYG